MVKTKLLVLLLFAAGTIALLLTDNAVGTRAHAYSSGPPAGFTRAPGELDCSDCHTTPAQSSGTLRLDAPQSYTPRQTYDVTVTHTTADPTRVRWGFELTALDAADQRAGTFTPADDLTQAVEGQGPFPARQYIEHTQKGTFAGRQNGATWTFKWTAPDVDVGPVTFYVAGNQANGDGNTSGDNIYFTFAAASFRPPTPDFQLNLSPASRFAQQGNGAAYTATVTPLNGFTGQVTLALTGLPQGFTVNPGTAQLDFTDATPRSVTFNVGTSASVPAGTYNFGVSASSGQLSHTSQGTLVLVAPGDADLAVTQTASPNPARANADTRFTVTVTNNGPALATPAALVVKLPAGFSSFLPGATPCQLDTAALTYTCANLPQLNAGQSVAVDFTVRMPAPGVFNFTSTVSGTDHDPLPSNNTATTALPVDAESAAPSMTVPGLGVRTVVAGLNQPTGLAFIGPEDFFVLEKATGRVVRVKDGAVKGAVLDLAVNSASERGLLGIALHPNFASNGFVYLYWTQSASGRDSTDINDVELRGNRVDRFVWDGVRLLNDRTLLRLRSQQTDPGQPARGNHNGGVLRFGPDGKLYVLVGDNGRRGNLQNLPCGPTTTCPGPTAADDQFGGPEPDPAHLTGVILRLNDDGSTPEDNPFFNAAQTSVPPQAVSSLMQVYAYGVRNGFGMDFDPLSGTLWTQENGDDAFDEINRVEAGFNGGWVQLMGPSSRVSEFKSIEVARGNSLQQNRWPPSNIADTPAEALARLFVLPGSHYTEPEFSWKYAVAPSPIGFARGTGLGALYAGDLFVGASRTTLLGGYLMRFKLSADRKHFAPADARLADGVADNADKFDLAESESLVVGRDFGITTDIQTEPSRGGLYVVSLSNGAVYEVSAHPTLFVANLDGAQETPPHTTAARGTATLLLDKDEKTARVSLRFRGLSSPQTVAHIHAPAAPGQSAPPAFDLPAGDFSDFRITLTPQQVSDLKAGLFYVNVHSQDFPSGEIRGQFGFVAGGSSVFQFDAADGNVPEGAQVRSVNVQRLGDASTAATVDYSTADGTASERSDYTTARGTLRFAPGETQKSFDVLITDDGLAEPAESFSVSLSNPSALTALNAPSSATLTIIDNDSPPPAANPIDDSSFFVRQHYHDFLNREPDAEGFRFWTDEIERCGTDALCREVKRINVSAAFFLSIEFQRTGLLAYLTNRAAFGNATSAPSVPVRYAQFMREVQALQRGYVFGQPGAEARLEANRRAYFDEFVTRPEFVGKYGSLSNADYVRTLMGTARLALTIANIHIARLEGAQQVPPTGSPATGAFILRRPASGGSLEMTAALSLKNLSSPVTAVHLHGPAAPGAEAPAVLTLPAGEFTDFTFTLTQEQFRQLSDGLFYVDVHTQNNPGGEIRGQVSRQRFREDVLTLALDEGTLTRAEVLRVVAESDELRQAEFRRAFVLMQYFGYLRRDPDAEGFDFWLSKLNAFGGDYVRAEMVKAFISSVEYRRRFGP